MSWFDWLMKPKVAPQTKYVVRNVLNETIAELPFLNPVGQDLRGKDFSHASFRGENFIDCDLRGANFLGANLENATFFRCTLTDACLAYSRVEGARFDQCNLAGIDLGNAVGIKAFSFRRSLVDERSTIPGIRVTGEKVIG